MSICLSRLGMYLPQQSGVCSGTLVECPNFFVDTRNGDLSAYLCEHHRDWWWKHGPAKSYLTKMLAGFRPLEPPQKGPQ